MKTVYLHTTGAEQPWIYFMECWVLCRHVLRYVNGPDGNEPHVSGQQPII
jgi:hypothetical protein